MPLLQKLRACLPPDPLDLLQLPDAGVEVAQRRLGLGVDLVPLRVGEVGPVRGLAVAVGAVRGREDVGAVRGRGGREVGLADLAEVCMQVTEVGILVDCVSEELGKSVVSPTILYASLRNSSVMSSNDFR